MSTFSYVLGALVLFFVLLRQIRVRPVRRVFAPQLPLFLGVIGFFTMVSYAGSHHVDASAWLWVLVTMLVGALGLGALRGLSMRVWPSNGWVVRQGNAVTMALWLVSILVHFVADAGGNRAGAVGLEGASFLLYLGVTLAMQSYVVHRRALPLWAQLGPEAGRPFQVHVTQGPGMFFTTFRSPGAGPPGRAPAGTAHDPNVIDVEVVEDDDLGPPELPAPH